MKSSHNNNKFKISAPTWNDKFELPDGSCSVSNIQDQFEYILEQRNTDNPSVKIYVNKIKDRITFKNKSGYYFESSTPETMKLLGSTKSKIDKNKNGENIPHLKITDSRVLYTFVSNKLVGS